MTGKTVNHPNSQNDVIKSMTHVMLAIEEMVRGEMPDCATVYDEQLSYETGIKKILTDDNFNNGSRDPLPAFIYNRTVLEYAEEPPARRSGSFVGCMRVGDEVVQYSAVQGEFELQFLYVSKSIELQEKFEIVYLSNEGITGTKEVVVSMGELGDFKYFLDYQDLTEKQIVHEDVYYKGIIGSIRVRGFFFTFRSKTRGLIEEISSRIIAGKAQYNEDGTLKTVDEAVDQELLAETELP